MSEEPVKSITGRFITQRVPDKQTVRTPLTSFDRIHQNDDVLPPYPSSDTEWCTAAHYFWLKEFTSPTDPYADRYVLMAATMFHVGVMDVTKEQRQAAKRRTFELLYDRKLIEDPKE
jgi:hypothetical protein